MVIRGEELIDTYANHIIEIVKQLILIILQSTMMTTLDNLFRKVQKQIVTMRFDVCESFAA